MKTLGLGLGLGNVRLLGPDQISNLQLRVRSDAKAVSGSTLTGLTDLSGNAQTITVAGAPSIVAADCNGFDAMSFSGTSDKFSATFTQAFPVSYALVLEILAVKRVNDAAFVVYPVLQGAYLDGVFIAVGGTGSGTGASMTWIGEV